MKIKLNSFLLNLWGIILIVVSILRCERVIDINWMWILVPIGLTVLFMILFVILWIFFKSKDL